MLIVKSKEIDNAMQNFCNRVSTSFKRKTSQEFFNKFVAVRATKLKKKLKNNKISIKLKAHMNLRLKWSELILVSLA